MSWFSPWDAGRSMSQSAKKSGDMVEKSTGGSGFHVDWIAAAGFSYGPSLFGIDAVMHKKTVTTNTKSLEIERNLMDLKRFMIFYFKRVTAIFWMRSAAFMLMIYTPADKSSARNTAT